MRWRVWLYGSIGAVAVFAASLVAIPFALRSYAVSQAQQRGFDAEIGSVSIRPSRIWLHDVRLTLPSVPGFLAELPALEVRFGLSGLRRLQVHGGSVQLEGELEQLLDRLRGGATKPRSAAGGGGRPIGAHGMYFSWRASEARHYEAWGLRMEREAGEVSVRTDLVRARHDPVEVEVLGLQAQLETHGLLLRRLDAARTQVRVRLQSSDLATAPASGAPSGAGKQPKARKSRLARFSFSPGRGTRLRSRLSKWTGIVARRLPDRGGLDLDGVAIVLEHGAERLNIGPARFRASRGERSLALSFVPITTPQAGSKSLEVQLVSPLDEGQVELRVSGGPLSLSQLGVRTGDFGLNRVERATLRLSLEAKLSESGDTAELTTDGELRNLTWWHPKVAEKPLTEMGIGWSGHGKLALDGSSLGVDQVQVRFGAVTATGHLQISRDEQRFALDGGLEVPSAACQDMFDSLPLQLVPLLEGARFQGSFSWKGAVSLDSDRPSDVKASWRMQNGCKVVGIPPAIDPSRFEQPFSRTVPSPTGPPLLVWSGPGTADWVPLENITRYMELAVLTTEDGGFWRHRGFDQRAIEGSIRQNLQEGRFVRGASTISMQLAKNLYLSRDKQLSRKVQEALLTMLLEQELTKAQILELYFNVIEFGPDVWGINMAADHYFHSRPRELSIAQSFFLASLLPKPLAEHFEEDGSLKRGRQVYVRRLMRIAHERGRLTAEELADGLAQPVQLGVPHLSPEDGFAGDDSDWEEGREIPGP